MIPETDLSILADIIERMPGGFLIYRADESTELLYVNDVAIEIFGCENLDDFRELTGYTFKGMVHPDDYEEVNASISRQVHSNDKEIDSVEYRIIRKDGSIRWVDDCGRLAHTPSYGEIFYVFIRDITDIHAAREENLIHEKIIEGLSLGFSGIYLVNLDSGTIKPYLLNNEKFNQLSEDLGTPENDVAKYADLAPLYAKSFIVPEDRQAFLDAIRLETIRENLKNSSSYTFTYRCNGINGDIIYLEIFLARIEKEETAHNIVVGFRNVTHKFVDEDK